MKPRIRMACGALTALLVLGGAEWRANAQSAGNAQAPTDLIKVPAEVPADAAHYTFLLAGNKAGLMDVWTTADGSRHNFFAFNDRGRGPAILTRVMLDRAGFPTQMDASGNDYLKGPVDEHFQMTGTPLLASWSNKAEKGKKQLSAPAFYVPIDAMLTGEMETALLAAPGGRLPLLPEGEARIERVLDRTVEWGGKKHTVTLYEESGLSFTPAAVWLTEDHSLLAAGGDWGALVREDAAANWPELLAAQKANEAARGEALARKLEHHPAGKLLIEHARLFDSESATVKDGMSVLVSGHRIEEVAPDGKIAGGAGAEVIDAKGKMLLPGLWDMHVHVGQWDDGMLHIAAGVTTVRDMGNDIDHLNSLRQKFDAGTLIGPRVVMAGLIDGRGPYQGPTKVFGDTKEEVLADIERFKSLGYEQIKIYSSVKPELMPYIAEQAHAHGMRVSGHVPAFMTAEQFIRGGADEIQHMNFIFLNFFFDQVQDTRTPARFTYVAEHASGLDLHSERVQAFVKLMQEHHTVLDPTVTVFEEMFDSRPGVMSPPLTEVASRLPAQIRRGGLTGGLPVPPGKDQTYRDAFQAMLHMVKLLHDSGITIVAGTDSLAGFTLHRELENYVAAGIPAPVVLQIATLGGARVMKHDGERGSIAPGKQADMILVNGDPTARISDIRRVSTVIKDGTVYDAAAVYAELGVGPPN
ncbi:MAG TPA: amidohydrolase family protein [Patescibacteria group bacterium]|nr:amidohydrolase family protein [Patescibacteria group bacterium]